MWRHRKAWASDCSPLRGHGPPQEGGPGFSCSANSIHLLEGVDGKHKHLQNPSQVTRTQSAFNTHYLSFCCDQEGLWLAQGPSCPEAG